MTKFVSGVLLALSMLPVQQPSADAVDLASGIRQVEEQDYRAALVTLDGVVHRLGGDPAHQKDLALAHLYLGAASLGLQQNDRAETEMREAARLDPTLQPDSKSLSNAAVALFEKARQHPGKSSKTVPLVIAGGAAVAGGVALAVGGGSSNATSPATPTTPPVVVTPPTTVPATQPPPTTARGPQASAFGVFLVGAGTSARHEVHVGTGTLVARYEGLASEVQVIVNDATGTNIAVDSNYQEACNRDKVTAEARVPVIEGNYSVIVKVGQNTKAACCRLPNCGCQAEGSAGCFFVNGQISIFYPAP